MIIYSKQIISFVNEVKAKVKDILSREVRLKVAENRFYNWQQEASYPIKIVIYNNKSLLGYFDSDFYELGFNACLMQVHSTHLHNVIRHELAHYLTFITHGEILHSHGIEFKAMCQQLGWNEEVSRASFCLEEESSNISTKEENDVLRKVQKLMALASSSNENEAEQAMIKSQQLLVKHHLEFRLIDNNEEETVFLKRIMKQKKENAKMRAIATILETFFVNVVLHRAREHIYLEILGSRVNLEIAEYVAHFLIQELEHLWKQAQKTNGLRGIIAKNSFFLGIAKGYCNKIHALKRDYHQETTQALMVIEKQLKEAKEMVYRRLSYAQHRARYCAASGALGERMGHQLSIRPAVRNAHGNRQILIGS